MGEPKSSNDLSLRCPRTQRRYEGGAKLRPLDTDKRRTRDGRNHQDTFAFVCIDLYVGRPAPDFSNQLHDFDPGLDNGLFWTVPIDKSSVKVNPGSGRASLIVKEARYGSGPLALLAFVG